VFISLIPSLNITCLTGQENTPVSDQPHDTKQQHNRLRRGDNNETTATTSEATAEQALEIKQRRPTPPVRSISIKNSDGADASPYEMAMMATRMSSNESDESDESGLDDGPCDGSDAEVPKGESTSPKKKRKVSRVRYKLYPAPFFNSRFSPRCEQCDECNMTTTMTISSNVLTLPHSYVTVCWHNPMVFTHHTVMCFSNLNGLV
jgi:hypothetical protein